MTTIKTLGLLSAAGLAACAAIPHSVSPSPASLKAVAAPAADATPVIAALPPGPVYDPLDRELLELVNVLRADRPLNIDERLQAAAQEQASYCATTGYFDRHVNGTPSSRAAKHGFNGLVGECLAGDFSTATNCVNGWRGSPGHYATMIGDFDSVGFGLARGRNGNIWCAVFGNSKQPASAPSPAAQPVATYRQPQTYSSCSGPGCSNGGWRPFGGFFRRR